MFGLSPPTGHCYAPSYLQKRELVKGFGVYVSFVDLEQAEQSSKNTATGLMRAIISLWYSGKRLAACSANSGIRNTIRTAVFSKCKFTSYVFFDPS